MSWAGRFQTPSLLALALVGGPPGQTPDADKTGAGRGGDRSGGRLGSDRHLHAEPVADADQSGPYQRPCVLQSAQYRVEQRRQRDLRRLCLQPATRPDLGDARVLPDGDSPDAVLVPATPDG